MPSAHFREFNGIAPRVRGKTSYAIEADGVDLYGGTIRPQFKDLDTDETITGPFVRVDDQTIQLDSQADDLRLIHFKGYKVVFFRKGKIWYKGTFQNVILGEQPTLLETEMGFTPPLLISPEEGDATVIRDETVSVRGETVDGGTLSKPLNVDLKRSIITDGKVPIPEDVYTYFVDVYAVINGEEVFVERSGDTVVKLEYEHFVPQKPYDKDSPEGIAATRRGDSEKWFVRSESSPHGVISLIDLSDTRTIGDLENFNADFGHFDTGEILARAMNLSARDLRTGKGGWVETTSGPDARRNFTVGEGISDFNEYGPFIWQGEAARWWYPVSHYEGLNYGKPLNNHENHPNYNIIDDERDIGNPRRFLGSGGVVIEKLLDTREGDQIFKDVVIHDGAPNIRGEQLATQVVFTMRSSSSSRVRSKTSAPGAENVEYPGDFIYRLYRKGEKESKTRLVAESNNAKNIVLVDSQGIREVDDTSSQPIYSDTLSYQITYERVAASGNDKLADWVEESGPSNAVEVAGLGARNRIKMPFPKKGDVSLDSSITHWRIYRKSQGGDDVAGTSEYQLVERVEVSETEYFDVVPTGSLGQAMDTQFLSGTIPFQYGAMPEDIEGISSEFHDGMLFAWKGNQLFWTDRFYPSGFSETFQADMPRQIVAVEPIRGGIAVLTTDGVYRGVTSGPANFDFSLSPSEDGAVQGNSRSVIQTSSGVVYLSDSGLHLYNGSDARSLTDGLIGEEYFKNQINASSVILETNDRSLYVFHDQGVLILDTRDKSITTIKGLNLVHIFRDQKKGSIYYRDPDSNNLNELFGSDQKRSMTYTTGQVNFGIPGRKRIKYIEFLGIGKITCTAYYDGNSTIINEKEINMDGMERDRRISLPNGKTLKFFTMRLEGIGEVEEFKIIWERM